MSDVHIVVICAKCGAHLYHHVGTFWGEKDGKLRAEIVVTTKHECGGEDE